MQSDHTEQQTANDARLAKELSRQLSNPPRIPGYHVVRPVGAGAFGQVWLATDLNTSRSVAIKCYPNRAKLNLQALEREVNLLVSMSAGRHIVQVLEVGWEHEPPFFVMEYLESGSLDDLMRGRSLSVSDCVHYIREIASGLQFAHEKGVIHCDLKPANVLIDHSLQPRIADFGQGRMSGDQTPSLGTLFYMAPEQAQEEAIPDVKWDVYALGAIAYTLLVGSPPYRSHETTSALELAPSFTERLKRYREAITASPLPKAHYRVRGVDKPLGQIIDRCLSVNPAKRFQNIQQVIGALDSRLRARTRRPLYLLGLTGPILLMTVMLVFSAKTRMKAVKTSEDSVVLRALESNRFAARYAARTLETELQTLFSIVREEARQDGLKTLLEQCAQAAKEPLSLIRAGQKSNELTEVIRQLPEQSSMQNYLEERMSLLLQTYPATQHLINSIFINEANGTNLGIVFRLESEADTAVSPVGQNYAYRSYFNGNRSDGKSTDLPSSFRATVNTALSASFRSTSTGAWKIAVSTPVWQSDDPSALDRPLGVLSLTINLGDFELLDKESAKDAELQRFAALFDGRQGNQLGTLLEHPYIGSIDRHHMKSLIMPQIGAPVVEQLIKTGMSNYLDPTVGKEGGESFAGEWLACVSQVELPRTAGDNDRKEKSDLWILVQERRSSVAAPIQSLAQSLRQETLLEFLSLVGVVSVLWYFVFRITQSMAAQPLNRSSGDSGSSKI